MESVSLVCVIYNHYKETVEKMVSSAVNCLQYCSYLDYDIIIVDNSEDSLLDCSLLNNICNNKLIYIKSDTNLGYCGGNNLGIKNSPSDYIIITNPDIIFLEALCFDWIVGYSKFKNTISGKLVGCNKWYTYASSFPTDRKYSPEELPFYYNEPTLKKPGNWKSFKYIDGSLMCFPKKLWEDVGGFDEDYFPGYFGENVFAFKAYLKGYILQNSEIHNYYKHEHGKDRSDEQKIMEWSKEGRRLFYEKYALPNYDKFLKYLNN